MSRPHPPFTGTCLCGAVTVRVTEAPMLTFACHCADCQKLTASAYSLSAMFAKDAFSCTGALAIGGLKSEDRTHYFCKSCLNFVYSQVGGPNARINLRLSMLDNADLFPPFLEMMTDEKLPWAHVPALHSYPQFPSKTEEFQDLVAAYANW